jgi:hypothetical protein
MRVAFERVAHERQEEGQRKGKERSGSDGLRGDCESRKSRGSGSEAGAHAHYRIHTICIRRQTFMIEHQGQGNPFGPCRWVQEQRRQQERRQRRFEQERC